MNESLQGMADFLDESFGGASCAVLSGQKTRRDLYAVATIVSARYSLLKWQYENGKNAKLNCS